MGKKRRRGLPQVTLRASKGKPIQVLMCLVSTGKEWQRCKRPAFYRVKKGRDEITETHGSSPHANASGADSPSPSQS